MLIQYDMTANNPRICSLLSLHPYFGTLVRSSSLHRRVVLTWTDSMFERDGTLPFEFVA